MVLQHADTRAEHPWLQNQLPLLVQRTDGRAARARCSTSVFRKETGSAMLCCESNRPLCSGTWYCVQSFWLLLPFASLPVVAYHLLAMIETITSTVDDIEDALPSTFSQRPVRSAKLNLAREDMSTAAVPEEAKRSVPGVQTVYVRTFGCSHNQSDSEYMMGILQAYGYRCGTQRARTSLISPSVQTVDIGVQVRYMHRAVIPCLCV